MRKLVLLVVMASVLCAVLGYLAVRMNSAKESAHRAAEDLQACRILADRIHKIATAPKKALEEQRSLDDLSSRVEQAATAAKLPDGAVARILPQADRRLGDSAYIAQPTRLECRNVRISELVFFLSELISGDAAIHATTIRLSLPHGVSNDDSTEAWNAEVVLTHLLYSPNSSAK